jgi:hypothetical protein
MTVGTSTSSARDRIVVSACCACAPQQHNTTHIKILNKRTYFSNP